MILIRLFSLEGFGAVFAVILQALVSAHVFFVVARVVKSFLAGLAVETKLPRVKFQMRPQSTSAGEVFPTFWTSSTIWNWRSLHLSCLARGVKIVVFLQKDNLFGHSDTAAWPCRQCRATASEETWIQG